MMQYRLTVTYRRTRPYYPKNQRLGSGFEEYYQRDIDYVGKEQTLTIGPHKSLGTVKAQYKRAKNSYPLANIYGDNELGYEVLDERWEQGKVYVKWEPVEA